MTATLNTMIAYDNGTITIIQPLKTPVYKGDCELIESGCKGWGKSNVVVRWGGSYFLATI